MNKHGFSGIRAKVGPQARVFTYPEVMEILGNAVAEVRAEYEHKFTQKAQVLAQADIADHEKALTILYLNVLADMGLQRGGMENFLTRVADYAERLNAEDIEYDVMRKRIEDLLGYELHDFDLVNELAAQINDIRQNQEGDET